jgi:PqqD family protein of HPr-rel-A system
VSSTDPFESPESLLPDPHWTAASPGELLWAEWDGRFVLYHRPAGRTHIVNEPTWLLLNAVLRETRDLASTTQELARLRDMQPDEELRGYVAGLLLHLEELGLVVRS